MSQLRAIRALGIAARQKGNGLVWAYDQLVYIAPIDYDRVRCFPPTQTY